MRGNEQKNYKQCLSVVRTYAEHSTKTSHDWELSFFFISSRYINLPSRLFWDKKM